MSSSICFIKKINKPPFLGGKERNLLLEKGKGGLFGVWRLSPFHILFWVVVTLVYWCIQVSKLNMLSIGAFYLLFISQFKKSTIMTFYVIQKGYTCALV